MKKFLLLIALGLVGFVGYQVVWKTQSGYFVEVWEKTGLATAWGFVEDVKDDLLAAEFESDPEPQPAPPISPGNSYAGDSITEDPAVGPKASPNLYDRTNDIPFENMGLEQRMLTKEIIHEQVTIEKIKAQQKLARIQLFGDVFKILLPALASIICTWIALKKK